jgi:NitT/TauT family transport system ATP-binding protein
LLSTASSTGAVSSTSGSANKVDIRDLSKIFMAGGRQIKAIENVSLSIPRGQFVCLVGPSGCGKTTLLRIVAGLEQLSYGEVRVQHEDKAKPVNSMIFQEQSLFPWMTVRDNVSYGLRMRKMSKAEYTPIVDQYLAKVGLAKFADVWPHQLSGGMKQRVSIARAFANDPEILLMDDPFAALDEQNKTILQEELLRIWDETRKSVIFINHSIDEALIMSDRVIVMTAHPGHIKADIRVDFARPREVYKLKATPEFGQLAYEVWELLKEEVMRAKQLEAAGVEA